MTWIGKRVENSDGRNGFITGEIVGFQFIRITITIDDSDGKTEDIRFSDFAKKDSGATGWYWYINYENPTEPKKVTLLGDHNPNYPDYWKGFPPYNSSSSEKKI